ncbi:MAG: hypothetical protein QOG43_430 [Actinomycetota bacterium]|jgi:hypothetical protein|nr:hypothetical protein [Actinomycetota bacterium]
MRKWMAVAGVAVLATVGGVVLTQSLRDDKTTPTPEPTSTLAPATTVPVPYDPNTGVVGTIPPVDPNAGEGILSSGGT